MDFKSFSQGVDFSGDRMVTGYLASFGSLDSDGDIIQKGAFSKTIMESWKGERTRIKYLQDHDTNKVVGVFTELKEDDFGLFYSAKIGTHTAGEDYYKMLKDGIVDQHSIGYKTKASKKEGNARVLTELQLFEGSGLQFRAANYNTPVLSVKGLEDMSRELGKLEYALKNATYSDEAFLDIESRINSIQKILSTKKATGPDKSTQPDIAGLILKHF